MKIQNPELSISQLCTIMLPQKRLVTFSRENFPTAHDGWFCNNNLTGYNSQRQNWLSKDLHIKLGVAPAPAIFMRDGFQPIFVS